MRGSRAALRQRPEPCIKGFIVGGGLYTDRKIQAPLKGLLKDGGASVGTFRIWSFQEAGAFFGGPHDREYRILGSTPCLWKLLYRTDIGASQSSVCLRALLIARLHIIPRLHVCTGKLVLPRNHRCA